MVERTPWKIEDADRPLEETRSSRLEFLVRFAILAPSTHNSQPWKFRVRGDALELLADRSKRLPVADPEDRELTISCGAALQFARLAARNLGREGIIEVLPEPEQPDLLGRLRLGAVSSPTPGERRRFAAMPDRHTNRTHLEATPDLSRHLADAEILASHYGVILHAFAEPPILSEIAELVEQADRFQMADAAFRRELASWVRSAKSARQDGMSVSSFGLNDALSGGVSAAISAFDLGPRTAAKHRALALGAPAIALFATIDDDVKSWMRTGMALADVLLELTARGLSASFLNQPVELTEFRHKLEDRFAPEVFPQMLMRVGAGNKAPAAARRPAEAVTEAG